MDGLYNHDLRRSFITIGFSACDIELFKMELLTNHVPEGVTARHYLQTSRLQYLYPETQRISDHIEREGAIARAKVTGGNVVAMPQRARRTLWAVVAGVAAPTIAPRREGGAALPSSP